MKTDIQKRIDFVSNTGNISEKTLPISAKIEISGKCTFSCKFCCQHTFRQKNIRQRLISDDEFELILKFLQTIPTIQDVGLFYMGESAMHPNLAKYYKKLKEHGYFTYLTTNCSILSTVLEAIPYVDSLKVSWNYRSITDFCEKTRMPKEMYYKVIENISLFYNECHKYNKKLAMSTLLDTKQSEYNNVLKTLKYDEHYWIPLQTQGGMIDDGVDGCIGQADNTRGYLPCWTLFKSLYIDSDLNVRSCIFGHSEKHILYNIKDNNSYSISGKLLEMRKKHICKQIPLECKECLKNIIK